MTHLQEIHNYWNSRSEGFRLQVEKEMEEGRQEIYLKYFKKMSIGSKVLDVGCGPGFFTFILDSLGMEVTAVDYSEKMIEEAKKLFGSAGKVDFLQADAQNLPFESNKFDAVVSRNLVWNLENPERAYREWLRVLKPAGSLFIFDGNHYSYLYDPDYASVQQKVEKSSNHILLNVNPMIIDKIAEELPLSRCKRPAWDEKVLKSQGAQNIRTEILDWIEDSRGHRLPMKFGVFAEKSDSR